MAAQLILSLSILVTLHELGHFLVARAFGIRVEKFYIFFDAGGFKLFSFTKGGVEYGIGWLPLGGYVKISGMIDESLDTDQMAQEPQPWEFRSKPAWQRFLVMVAGVIMNVILGVIIYFGILLAFEKGYVTPEEINRDGIYAYEYGREIGFQSGDKLLAVNNEPIERAKDAIGSKILFGGTVTVLRDGQEMEIALPDTFGKAQKKFAGFENFAIVVDSVVKANEKGEPYPGAAAGLQAGDKIIALNAKPTPSYGSFKEQIVEHVGEKIELSIVRDGSNLMLPVQLKDSSIIVGFAPINPYKKTEYSVGSAFTWGIHDAFTVLIVNAVGFKRIFQGKVKATESVSGPIKIAQIFGKDWIWSKFWGLTAMLSMVLAFVNILPIPALDGGHAMFLVIEAVRGKPLSDKWMYRFQIVGFVLVVSLMVFALGNDIFNIFFN